MPDKKIHQRPQIVSPNGLPYHHTESNDIDEMKTGIEKIIEMQEANDGKGVTITPVQLQTIIIYELWRTKHFALEQVAQLTVGLAAANAHIVKLRAEMDIVRTMLDMPEVIVNDRPATDPASEDDERVDSPPAS